jgi:hypothetical protein
VVKILWSVLTRILLPIDLSRIPQFLEKFVAHLQRPLAKTRPRQIDRMRAALNAAAQQTHALNHGTCTDRDAMDRVLRTCCAGGGASSGPF